MSAIGCGDDRLLRATPRRLPQAGRRAVGPSISADGRVCRAASGQLVGGALPCGSRGMDLRVGPHDRSRDCVAPEQRRHHGLGHSARVHVERRRSRPAVHERHRPCVRRRAGEQHELVCHRRPERHRRQRRRAASLPSPPTVATSPSAPRDEPPLPGRRQQRPMTTSSCTTGRSIGRVSASRDLFFAGGNDWSGAPAIAAGRRARRVRVGGDRSRRW